MKLLCVRCRVEFRPKQNEVKVVEMFNSPPRPYRIWEADLWACPGCGTEVVDGFARAPVAEHFQESFKGVLERVCNLGAYEDYEKVADVPQHEVKA